MADTTVGTAAGTAVHSPVSSTIPDVEATSQATSVEAAQERAGIDEPARQDDRMADSTAVGPESAPASVEEGTAVVRLRATAFRPNVFNIIVGSAARCFSIDLNDLRRESALFRHSTCITSIELRREDPVAVQLIANWFHGSIGLPPVSKESRDVFVDAARIARQLQITECENQLIVIVRKTTASLANIMYDQIADDLRYSLEEIIEYVCLDLEGYMIRSVNEGGQDAEGTAAYESAEQERGVDAV